MTAPAIAYARISVEDEHKKGVSIEAQIAAVETYCSLREFELIEPVCVDEGVSAATRLQTRSSGSRIIEAINSGRVKHVVAYKLDRLFRDAQDCLTVVSAWERAGIALHLTSQSGSAIDTTSAMGRFFLLIMAGFAEMERNLISERTRSALQHKKSLGQLVGSVPYGFVVEVRGEGREAKKWLVPNPAEQAVVTRIVREYGMSRSLRQIAAGLDRDGIPARGSRKKMPPAGVFSSKWTATAIVRILENHRKEAAFST